MGNFQKEFFGSYFLGEFFWEGFFGRTFWDDFFGRIFWEDSFWKIFLRGLFGGFLGRKVFYMEGINLFVKILIFVKILSKSK